MIGVIRWYLTQELHFWTPLSWRCVQGATRYLRIQDHPGCTGSSGYSESTLYPVLRRLQKDDCLEVYDQAYAGRKPQILQADGERAGTAEFVQG